MAIFQFLLVVIYVYNFTVLLSFLYKSFYNVTNGCGLCRRIPLSDFKMLIGVPVSSIFWIEPNDINSDEAFVI